MSIWYNYTNLIYASDLGWNGLCLDSLTPDTQIVVTTSDRDVYKTTRGATSCETSYSESVWLTQQSPETGLFLVYCI